MIDVGAILRSKVARWTLVSVGVIAVGLGLVAAAGGGSISFGEYFAADFAAECDCEAMKARVADLEQQMADVHRQIPPLAQCCAGQAIE